MWRMDEDKFYTYTTKEGDFFDLLALRYYDEEKMAHHIIQANPDYADVIIFDGGIKLVIPVVEETESTELKAPWRR